jgi:hypothetical protein
MATKGIGRPLTILLQADTTGLGKGLADAQTKLGKFGGELESLSRKATLVFAGVAAAGFKVVQSASDLNESISKSEVVFGESAKAISAWSKTTAQALGLSQVASLEAASNFAILGQSAGLTGGDLADFSTDLTGLAADLASFNNTSVDEAITALAAGLRGESEPLRKFGVLLSAGAVEAKALEMGLAATTKELTDQDKVLARNALILEQTTLQQGDFARTADGAANQQRILAAEIENSRAAIGQGLLPAYKDLLAVLVQVADWAGKNSTTIRNLGVAIAVLSAAVIGLNLAFKAATIAVQAFTVVAAALRLGYLTLAAATGSATAAQLLAELTYKNSRVAALLYTAALGVQTVATNLATVGIKAFTLALLTNPFTAVAVAITAIATALYKVWDAGKKANEALIENAQITQGSQKSLESDAKAARKAATDKTTLTNATKSLTVATNAQSVASSKGSKAAQKAADALAKQKQAAKETKQAFADYAKGVKEALSAQFSFQSAFEQKGAGSFLESLKKQAAAAIAFSGKIAKLVGLGLSRGSVDQVLAAGPDIGGQIADELIAGGAAAISDVNNLVSSVNQVTRDTGTAVSSALGGETGRGAISITINGAIDPEGVRRQLEALFQDSARRTAALNFAGAAL